MGIIWTIIIGFIAGIVAKFITPGSNEPSGFILTTILGIIGAFVATYLGQSLGWYAPGEGAGLVGAIVGELPTGAVAGIGAKLLAGAYYSQTIDIWAALVAGSVVAALLVALVGIAGRIVERAMGGRPA